MCVCVFDFMYICVAEFVDIINSNSSVAEAIDTNCWVALVRTI